jgi:hypothetical protein
MQPVIHRTMAKLTARYLSWSAQLSEPNHEDGFEIAQSMGIALLGLVVAAAFAEALKTLGVDVVAEIRSQLGL